VLGAAGGWAWMGCLIGLAFQQGQPAPEAPDQGVSRAVRTAPAGHLIPRLTPSVGEFGAAEVDQGYFGGVDPEQVSATCPVRAIRGYSCQLNALRLLDRFRALQKIGNLRMCPVRRFDMTRGWCSEHRP
jgi:hypothetical protein